MFLIVSRPACGLAFWNTLGFKARVVRVRGLEFLFSGLKLAQGLTLRVP